MAILKHLAIHNSNYHDFITYVLFQHDSHARPIYDENHVKHLRENVLIDAITPPRGHTELTVRLAIASGKRTVTGRTSSNTISFSASTRRT